MGGFRLKDLRDQRIALVVWICKASQGGKPWKVLIRHNIVLAHPSKGKFSVGLNIIVLLSWECGVKVGGSMVFQVIWKAWKFVRHFFYKLG